MFEDKESDSGHLNKDSNQTSNSKLKQEKPHSNEVDNETEYSVKRLNES